MRRICRLSALALVGSYSALLAFSANLAKAGEVAGGTIVAVEASTIDQNMVFIEVSGTKTGNPSCSTNSTWQFVLSLANATTNAMLVEIITARTTATPVTVYGAGTCSAYSTVEDLQTIVF
jgi:hypothetical protein